MLPSKVADKGYTKMLERFALECPKNQFLREFVKNGIQAIIRHKISSNNENYEGKIEVDVNWHTKSLTNFNKICFTDNGIGMTGEEMITFVNDLSSSADSEADYDNYGFGAKVSAAIKSKLGICYESWKDGKGHQVLFYYDKEVKKYGLSQFNTDGAYKYYTPIDDSVKPQIIEKNGTRVTLYGNTDNSDTYDNEYHEIKSTKESWVLSFLNKRFLKIPEKITIKVRVGHYREKSDTRHNFMAVVGGLEKTLDRYTENKGSVDLSDATIRWRILKEDRQGHGREFVAGHTAVINEEEVFDVSSGVGNKSVQFGIYIGNSNIVLHIYPKTKDYVQNTMRDRIVLYGEDVLPWEKWQNEFKERFPTELAKYLKDQLSNASKEDNSSSIKDKLKDLKKFFVISKYRKSKKGKYLIDEKELINNYTGGNEAIKNEHYNNNGGGRGKGSGSGLIKDLISLQIKEGITAEKVNPDPYPDVKWIKPGEQIEEGEIIDRAAIYRIDQNIVFANKEFNGFLDVIEHFISSFPGLPQENIIKIVQDTFAQQLMETVAGALTLKNRAHWTPNDFEKAISPESLTISVASRYYFFREIKRKLNDPNIKNSFSTS